MAADEDVPHPVEVESTSQDDEFDRFLAGARRKAEQGAPESVPIRELLRFAQAARRGTWVVTRLQKRLEGHGLFADPPLNQGWVDNHVVLRLLKQPAGQPGAATETAEVAPEKAHVALTVASLRSATAGICSIDRTEDISVARGRMLRHDYSQLPVLAGPRRLVGAVSWESMAKASLRGAQSLAEATIPTVPVRASDDLIALIPRIVAEGFVFVVGDDQTLTGVVTTADLSEQFATLANPFFLIGEIERRLRLIVDRHFTTEELQGVVAASGSTRPVSSADDLTLGEVQQLLGSRECWEERLRWGTLDRKEFVAALDEARGIRNDVMHFSPDPLTDEQLDALRNLLGWLRVMEPRT